MEIKNDFSKLSNEVLSYLGIKNSFFCFPGGITAMIKPLYIEKNKWEVLSSSTLPSCGTLVLEVKDSPKVEILCTVNESDNENINSYILFFQNDLDSVFLDKLSKFKKVTKESEGRKEARFNVGLDNWQTFGLLHPEVFLIANKKNYKCVINNVSFHGALLTGETAPIQQNETGINFLCRFDKPKINVLQHALVVNCQNLQKNYSRYSLQFLDPVSLAWQERLLEYAQTQG